jgi:AraC-like DNA-binding protein
MSAQIEYLRHQEHARPAAGAAVARALDEMAALIEKFAPRDGVHGTPIPRVKVSRTSQAGGCVHALHEPALGIVVQGRKRVMLAEEVYVYDRANFLVASVDLPVSAQVVEASPERPYLGFKLDLDMREVASLLLQAELAAPGEQASSRGIFLGVAGEPMMEAVLRLLRLLDAPGDIPALAPLFEREVIYRLLKSEQGWRVAQMCTVHTQAQRIGKAIGWLKKHFAEPLHIEAFARDVNMSPSSLHHHFKAVTAMSPLQFQKQLRLQEARRLLLAEGVDAATAGHRVGYESASQFSREYSRLFGAPPARDLRRLRELQPASMS